MINKIANYFEDFARQLGLSIKIPRPGKTMKTISILTNGIVGIGFILSGMVFKKLPLVLLGIIGIAGAALPAFDAFENGK